MIDLSKKDLLLSVPVYFSSIQASPVDLLITAVPLFVSHGPFALNLFSAFIFH